MAHKAHRKFVRSVRSKFPKYFRGTSVADVGSLDINEMLSSVLKPDMFSIYYLGQNTPSHDCQFYGIKKQ
jgi:hypothetical protein